MLRTKNKSVLSLLLALVMLVGVAVLAAVIFTPKAEAATAGQYTWRTRMVSDNDTGGWNGDQMYAYGCKTNGTAAQTSTAIASKTNYKIDFKGERTNTFGTGDHTTDEFPTKITYWFNIDSAWADRHLKFTLYLEIQDSSGNWVNVPLNLSYSNENNTSGSINGQYIDVTIHSSFSSKASKGTITYTVKSNKPKASSITGGTGFSAKTVTANETDGETITTSSAAATVKDQFGVAWYQDPQWTITDDNWGDVTCTGGNGASSSKATIPATSATSATKTFKLKAYRGDANSSITVTVQPTFKISYDTETNGGAANDYDYGVKTNTSSTSAKVYFAIPSANQPEEDDGWVFNGWATSSSATQGVIPDGTKTIEIDNYDDTIYATYKKELKINYHYITTSSNNAIKTITKDIFNHAESGTITAQQVTDALNFTANSTKVTYNGAEYTFKGWRTDTEASTGTGLSTDGQYSVNADNPTVERYAVYSTTNTAHCYYYNASGTRTSKDATGDAVLVNVGKGNNNATQASFTLPGVNPATATVDGRTFTFVGWRTDNANAAVKDKSAGDVVTRDFKKAGYNYYAVYSGDVTLSYNVNQRFTDGTDAVTGTVASNKTTQYAVADASASANAKRDKPAIAVNPNNVQLTRVGAEQFLGWAIIANGADTESETRQYPVTLAANASGALTIDTNTVLTAIFKDKRMTVKTKDSNGEELSSQQIRYNYSDRLAKYMDKTKISEDILDGQNHYYFNGWNLNSNPEFPYSFSRVGAFTLTPETVTVDDQEVTKDYYDLTNVRDDLTYTASYNGQTHHWLQDDLDSSEVHCNGVAGEGHAFANGGYHRYCTECGYGENDQKQADFHDYSPNTYVEIEAVGENYVMIMNNRPPTCTAVGSTGKQQCKLCFKILKEAEPVPALGEPIEGTNPVRYRHRLVDVEAPAGANYTMKRCTVCGHEEKYFIADAHTLVFRAARAATCTEEGYTEDHFYCTDPDCGKVYKDSEASREITTDVVIEPLGHEWVATEGTPATCLEDGLAAGQICSRCGVPQDENMIIPAKGHPEDPDRYETVEGVDATCTKDGKEPYKKCLDCNTVIEGGNVIPALGHELSGIRIDMPTCTEGGRTYRYCERDTGCDVDGDGVNDETPYEVPGQTLNPLGHDMQLKAGKAATCTAAGVKDYYECSRCHRTTSDAEGLDVIEDLDTWKVIDPLNHELGEAEVHPATCTAAGYTLRKCTREGCTYSERTEGDPATGHSGGAATCVSKAICEVCGKPYGNFGSHVWDQGVVTTEADCQHRQITTYTCTVEGCGATRIEKGGYGEHDYWVTAQTQPSCTAQGDVTRTCKVCGDVTHEYTDALGHSVSEWTLDGTVAKGTCSRCGQVVETTPAAAGITHKCEKCGLIHEGRTGIFVQDGLYCKIIGFFRRILHMFG